jgi:hypothetical protein
MRTWTLALIMFALSVKAATLWIYMSPLDPAVMGGMTTNDYLTNYSIRIFTQTNITIPPTNYILYTNYVPNIFLSQGPPGTVWSNTVPTPTNTCFFISQCTNVSNGGAGPFSHPFPFLPVGPSGGFSLTR